MKPSQNCLDDIAKGFGNEQMSNIVEDFELKCSFLNDLSPLNADLYFSIFCLGMANLMNPQSRFNKNYNKGYLDGAGRKDSESKQTTPVYIETSG